MYIYIYVSACVRVCACVPVSVYVLWMRVCVGWLIGGRLVVGGGCVCSAGLQYYSLFAVLCAYHCSSKN